MIQSNHEVEELSVWKTGQFKYDHRFSKLILRLVQTVMIRNAGMN